ncbi:MAG TPA: hypothetical protein QF455_00010 [Phycisphaerales bacterium]|nr:hypothetical protein [Phycisphaerales bacterium]
MFKAGTDPLDFEFELPVLLVIPLVIFRLEFQIEIRRILDSASS